MNEKAKNLFQEIEDLKQFPYFKLVFGEPRQDRNGVDYNPWYDEESFKVHLFIDKGMDFEYIVDATVKCHNLLKKAEKEYLHACNHPDETKAFLAMIKQIK